MSVSIARRTLLIAAAAAIVTPAWAAEPPIYQTSSNIAVNGYDVVAYFTESKPVEGSDAYTAAHDGATWRFASAEHRDLFVADPAKYAPQYGGYCAYAVSKGYTATTVPEAWKIVDGKLYLNYSLGVRTRWEQDMQGHISSANGNWPGVLN